MLRFNGDSWNFALAHNIQAALFVVPVVPPSPLLSVCVIHVGLPVVMPHSLLKPIHVHLAAQVHCRQNRRETSARLNALSQHVVCAAARLVHIPVVLVVVQGEFAWEEALAPSEPVPRVRVPRRDVANRVRETHLRPLLEPACVIPVLDAEGGPLSYNALVFPRRSIIAPVFVALPARS